MVKSSTYIILVLFILLSQILTAQDNEFVRGKLLDAHTGQAIVFATVQIKNKPQGVITNMDGGFRIPKQFREDGDTLQISSMGYRKIDFPLLGLSLADLNIIRLESGVLYLDEVVVSANRKRKLSAKEIVQQAVHAIPQNYPHKSFSTIGYYRDYQFKDSVYWNLNEAILEIFDYGFGELDHETTQVKLYQYGLHPNFPLDSLAGKAYNYTTNEKTINNAHIESFGGNEFSILRIHDAIRNFNIDTYDFVGTMKTNFIENHVFKKLKDTYMDEGRLHTITFKSQPLGYVAEGTLYISQTNYAIHKMQYYLYDTSSKQKLESRNTGAAKRKPIFAVVVEYKPFKDKMFINYISFSNEFQLHQPAKLWIQDILVNAPEDCFSVAFNKPIDINSAQKLSNYHIEFKGASIEIDEVKVYPDSVKIFPKLKKGSLNMMRELEVASSRGKFSEDLLKIEVNDIKDTEGNILNRNDIKRYWQFREYFVQQVKPNSRAPFDEIYMDKRKPLHQSTPKSGVKIANEFWSNTPMQIEMN